jgi:hypothetical protein
MTSSKTVVDVALASGMFPTSDGGALTTNDMTSDTMTRQKSEIDHILTPTTPIPGKDAIITGVKKRKATRAFSLIPPSTVSELYSSSPSRESDNGGGNASFSHILAMRRRIQELEQRVAILENFLHIHHGSVDRFSRDTQ